MPLVKPNSGSSKVGFACLGLFALLWNSFVIFWLIGSWLQSHNILFTMFGLPFLAVGIALAVGACWPLIIGTKLAPAEAHVSSTTLRPGEEFSFSYRQKVRRPVDVQRATYSLVLRESATYRQGTDTTTVTHEELAFQWDGLARSYEAGEEIGTDQKLRIPESAMHTFEAARNKLQWFVKVDLDSVGWADVKEAYEVRVLPERLG
jgi:hypothetical protein